MTQLNDGIRGVIHGNTIELEMGTGLPDGQQVTVIVQPAETTNPLLPGEGIRRSAGAWAEAGDELDSWLDEMQRSRQQDRLELS